MGIDDIKKEILETLTSGNPELLMNASKGSLVYYAIFHDEDDLTEKRSLKQIKEEWPNYSDYIDCAKEIINDSNSEYNKYINNYKKFLEQYKKLPKLFKEFFTASEIFMDRNTKNCYKTKYNDDFDDNISYTLMNYIYNDTNFKSVIYTLGFDGPDDEAIMRIGSDIFCDELIINGKIRFCVYGGTETEFKKLMKELDKYEESNPEFGTFKLSDTYKASDDFGISMDAVYNTDSERWICINFEFKCKI